MYETANSEYGPDGRFPFPDEDAGVSYAEENGVTTCPAAPVTAIYVGWVSAPQIIVARVQSSEPSYVSPTHGALDGEALDSQALDMSVSETNE